MIPASVIACAISAAISAAGAYQWQAYRYEAKLADMRSSIAESDKLRARAAATALGVVQCLLHGALKAYLRCVQCLTLVILYCLHNEHHRHSLPSIRSHYATRPHGHLLKDRNEATERTDEI